MKFKFAFLIFFILFNFTSSISKEIINELEIHKNLRCLVCQGQSISDSNSEFALTLKSVVKDLIDEGQTEDEIYSFLSDKYGDWILYKPKFNLENFTLWVFPYIVLIIGGFIIIFLIKKRSKNV